MYKVLSQIELSRKKLAGGPIEANRFVIPPECDYLKWFAIHIGATPIRHSATPRYDALTPNGNFTTTFGVGSPSSWFNLGGLPAGSFSIGETLIGGGYGEAANRFEWALTPNAITDTEFFIRIKFYTWKD